MMNDGRIRANVYVATPSYGSVVATGYVLGLPDLYDVWASHGSGMRTHFNSFDSLITRGQRNGCRIPRGQSLHASDVDRR